MDGRNKGVLGRYNQRSLCLLNRKLDLSEVVLFEIKDNWDISTVNSHLGFRKIKFLKYFLQQI